jgi:hypothetical protein
MNCEKAVKLLTKLDQAKQGSVDLTLSEQSELQELLRDGYVGKTQYEFLETGELADLKIQLAKMQEKTGQVRGEIAKIRAINPAIRTSDMKASLASKERDLQEILTREKKMRTQVLELSAKSASLAGSVKAGSERYMLTYKAREFLENALARLARVREMEMGAFERELKMMENLFLERAKKAFKVLKDISPKLKAIEEIHLRCAAIGLSIRPESPDAIADGFFSTIELLGMGANFALSDRPFISECLVENAPGVTKEAINLAVGDFTYLFKRTIKYVQDPKNALNCALLLHPLKLTPEDQEKTLQDAITFARGHVQNPADAESLIAPTILLMRSDGPSNPETVAKFDQLFQQISQPGLPIRDAAFAAGLFAISKETPDVLLGRYTAAKDYFGRFAETPMVLPAAMLALISSDIEETFDTLRFAASAISKSELSLGGLENLSLAAKLLALSSLAARREVERGGKIESLKVIPKDEVLPPSLQIVAFSVIPVALVAFTALHAMTFHEVAVRDYIYHPVHRHYVYYGHSHYHHGGFYG